MLNAAASITRLGTESAFEVLARAQKLAAEGKDVINLGIGQPDFCTPQHIVETGIKALRDGHHAERVVADKGSWHSALKQLMSACGNLFTGLRLQRTTVSRPIKTSVHRE